MLIWQAQPDWRSTFMLLYTTGGFVGLVSTQTWLLMAVLGSPQCNLGLAIIWALLCSDKAYLFPSVVLAL